MSATHDPSQPQRAVDVDPRSQLLVRTSQFLKKVSNFRTSRLKNESTSPPAMCERTARSMDLGSKAFVSHNVFDESPHGRSLDHDRESGSAVPRLVQPYASNSNLLASRSQTSGAVGAIDGLPSQPAPPYSLMPEPSTSTSARRALAPRLATLPPPMMARFNAQGSARLTPSIVTRQPPMPLLNLPMLPPPTQSQAQPIGRPQAPLRSIPALPMQGSGDAEQEADPETASLGDSDDDSDGGGTPETEAQEGSDEEDEEENSEPSPEVQEEARPRFSVTFADPTDGDAQRTPLANPMDYFNAKDPLRTPRPRDFGELRPRTESGSSRPGLYSHASKSMVNLLSMKPQTQESSAFAITEEPRASSSTTAPDFETSVRRRRSMPTFRYTSDPPPYPSFHPRGPVPGFVILPREEEGCERLPAYANAIYLCAIMPRKVEFLQPGVQARDRKWRRVLCVLEGTAFRVYKCPPGAAGVSALEEWWERKVGVGDITSAQSAVTATGVRVSAVRERPREPESPAKIAEERRESVPVPPASPPPQEEPVPPPVQPSRSRFHLPAGLLHSSRSSTSSRLTLSTGNSRSRLNADSQRDDMRQAPASIGTRQSSDTSNSSRSSGNTTLTTPTTTTASSPTTSTLFSTNDGASVFSRHRLAHANSNANANKPAPPTPDAKDLMRAYTLQNAESGLASDYTKRKNVVRVRMEGEQFLLQAQDVAAVIDWIEGIQAATAVAPDLDERPMPKGPIFPRRRRRRPRRIEGQALASDARNP